MKIDLLVCCYIGVNKVDVEVMFWKIGVVLFDELIDKIILVNIWFKVFLVLFVLMIEYEFVCYIVELVGKNKLFIIYIGMGWYNMIIFVVI